VLKPGSSQIKIEELKNPQKGQFVYSLDWDIGYEKSLMFGQDQQLGKHSQPHQFLDVDRLLKSKFDQLANWKSIQTGKQREKSINQLSIFLELVSLLRLSKLHELENFEKSIINNQQTSTPNSMVETYGQLLASCGSKICIRHLSMLIRQNQMSQMSTISALNEIRNAPVLSIDILREIMVKIT